MLTPYLGLFYQSFYSFPHDNLLFVLKLKLTKKRLTYKTTGLNNLIFMQFGIKGGWGVVSGQPKCFLRILSLDWSGGMWSQIFKPIVCLYRRKFLFVTSRLFKHFWFVNLCHWSFSQELKTLLYICDIFGKMCWNFSKIEFQLLTLACKAMRQTCTLGSLGPTNNNNLITILFWSWCKKGEWEQCLLTKKFLTRGTWYQNTLSKHVKYKRFGY